MFSFIKEAASVDTAVAATPISPSTTTDNDDEKKRDRLIREAGKAAYHAITTKSALTRKAAAAKAKRGRS
jgi:pyrrolidone-carboxylate peptidase